MVSVFYSISEYSLGMITKEDTLIPTFRRTAKIERQNTEESIGYDVTNRNIASLQCSILTPMTYGHERRRYFQTFFINSSQMVLLSEFRDRKGVKIAKKPH